MKKQDRKEIVAAYKERKIIGGVYGIKNTINGKTLILSATELQGSRNRFEFSKQTNSCLYIKLRNDWKEFGPGAFTFEILEELEKKESQTPKEFKDDIKVLEEIWCEKIESTQQY